MSLRSSGGHERNCHSLQSWPARGDGSGGNHGLIQSAPSVSSPAFLTVCFLTSGNTHLLSFPLPADSSSLPTAPLLGQPHLPTPPLSLGNLLTEDPIHNSALWVLGKCLISSQPSSEFPQEGGVYSPTQPPCQGQGRALDKGLPCLGRGRLTGLWGGRV